MDSYTAAYGFITYEDEIYDESIALIMRAPATYTAEDVVEFDCHGGISVLKRIFDLIVKLGARPAEPGEFTKRAFLNGRMRRLLHWRNGADDALAAIQEMD